MKNSEILETDVAQHLDKICILNFEIHTLFTFKIIINV